MEAQFDLLGETFRDTLDSELGLCVSAGWTLHGRSLPCARASLAVSQRKLEVRTTTVERWAPTPAAAVSIEAALSSRVAVRLDLTLPPAVEDIKLGSMREILGISFRF